MEWIYCWAQDPGPSNPWEYKEPRPYYFHVCADTDGGYSYFQTIRGHDMLYTRLNPRVGPIDSFAQLN